MSYSLNSKQNGVSCIELVDYGKTNEVSDSSDGATGSEKEADKPEVSETTETEAEVDMTIEDPFSVLPEYTDTGPKWSEMSLCRKILKIVMTFFEICFVFGFLYLFICAIDILGSAFQIMAGRVAGEVFTYTEALSNPLAGLMLGVLTTVLLQSSSTSTSIIITMVATGLFSVEMAIPMIMGCNIGTTVTNSLVSIGHITNKNEYRRAFAGATVHDKFNWFTVFVLLPVEVFTGMLFHLTTPMVQNVHPPEDPDEPQFLKVITKPLTDKIIMVDSSVITAIAEGNDDIAKRSLIRYWLKETTVDYCQYYTPGYVDQSFVDAVENDHFTQNLQIQNETLNNGTDVESFCWTDSDWVNSTKCDHIFMGSALHGEGLSEFAVGLILLIGSVACMLICLILMVKLLQHMLQGPALHIVRKFLNADFPGKLAFLTGYLAILLGAGLTILVQSSSVLTSILTPLVGTGVITVERMYPLTLGANIGTTMTGLMAAFTNEQAIQEALQISLCHIFFNLFGIIIFYPVPYMRQIPISSAKHLGMIAANYRWFPIIYIIMVFLVIPGVILVLAFVAGYVLLGVTLPFFNVAVVVLLTNYLVKKLPSLIPPYLQNWKFLPKAFRSLEPYDKVFTACCNGKRCCKCCKTMPEFEDDVQSTASENSKHETANDESTKEEIFEDTIDYPEKDPNYCDIERF